MGDGRRGRSSAVDLGIQIANFILVRASRADVGIETIRYLWAYSILGKLELVMTFCVILTALVICQAQVHTVALPEVVVGQIETDLVISRLPVWIRRWDRSCCWPWESDGPLITSNWWCCKSKAGSGGGGELEVGGLHCFKQMSGWVV